MKKYYVGTYGCQMNVHESEKIAGILHSKNYTQTDTPNKADIIVFNTCCVRDTAEKKIIGHIGRLKQLKRKNPNLIIAIVGCMTQQKGMKDYLQKSFPFIDVVLGTANLNKLSGLLDEVLQRRDFYAYINEEQKPKIIEDMPIYRTSAPNAWINIMYGCDNFCTYCIVPYVRGRERSRHPQRIVDEVLRLLDRGYKEITLLGQNVDSYLGCDDNGNEWNFAKLLDTISQIKGKFRIRFMSSHPKDFNKEIVDIIRSSKNICNNVHLPLQSGSNKILKLMNRKYTREHYLQLISDIKLIDNVGITTDVMVGFPTESEEDFNDTISTVKQVGYSNAFMFVYSPRKGTAATKMEQVPAEIKKERIVQLVDLQNSITREISKGYLGKVEEILVEDKNTKFKNVFCGRTDSGRLVNFLGDDSLIGQFVDVKITKAKSATLWGEYEKK